MASTKTTTKRKRGTPKTKLTDKQIIFIQAYMADNDFNVSGAARAAGYANPPQAGQKLLNNPLVAAAIQKELTERSKRLGITAEDVLRHLTNALYLDPAEFFRPGPNGMEIVGDIADIPLEIRRCIKGMKSKVRHFEDGSVETTVELTLMDKDKCLELAMKHLGLLSEKLMNQAKGEDAVNAVTFLMDLLQAKERPRPVVIDAGYIEQKAQED